jgi:hypothetical protein
LIRHRYPEWHAGSMKKKMIMPEHEMMMPMEEMMSEPKMMPMEEMMPAECECEAPMPCEVLAHSYVPWQFYKCAFSPKEALMKGTLFPELWGVYPIPK